MPGSRSKKKVLLAITKSNFGGAQRYVFDIARALPPSQCDVVVARGGRGTLSEKLREIGVRTVEIPTLERDVSVFADFSSLRTLIQIVRTEQPDVLHLNSSKMGLLGGIAGRLCGVPRIIFTAHGWAFNEDRPWPARIFLLLLSHTAVLLAHRTIAVSDAVRQAIVTRFNRSKIVVIPNGVTEAVYLEKNAARAALVPNPHKDEFWFGIVAELHRTKGLSYAVNALRHHVSTHPSARLVIVGEGDERERLTAHVHSLGLEQNVTFCGFVEDAARYLKAFDVFVLPSISEGLSYAILEAGAARVPVIASAVGGVNEIIEDGISGMLVAPRDARALSSAFERMSEDPAERSALAAGLKARVTSRFSLDTMYAQTIAQYALE